ncbi:MAG TPA: hypothetical protein VNB49_01635 [Candidatus Dormibacteraeota bacterium]|nr:hypothetical protein [Candidatus Dormibacteraeota bacterium]
MCHIDRYQSRDAFAVRQQQLEDVIGKRKELLRTWKAIRLLVKYWVNRGQELVIRGHIRRVSIR